MEHQLQVFLHYPQNHSVIWLGFGIVDKHVADIAHKHVRDIAQRREGLLYLTYMAEMA